jgi:hypothetical protein
VIICEINVPAADSKVPNRLSTPLIKAQLLASGGQLVENIKNGVTNAADQVKNAIGSVIEGNKNQSS